MKVATLQSQDIVSRRDIFAAYRYFNISPSEGKNIEDSRVLQLFQAQQPDLGPAAQEEARAHLYKLGLLRQSNLLINASRQSVETYEDALSWLGNGVNKDTPDEALLAVLAIRVSTTFSIHAIVARQQPLTTFPDRRQHRRRGNREEGNLRHCTGTKK